MLHRPRPARRRGEPHHRRHVVRRARTPRRAADPAVGAGRAVRASASRRCSCPPSSASGWRDASRRRRRSASWAGSRCRTPRGSSASALTVVAVLLALGCGAAWSGNWETVLLFFNGGDWGVDGPDARPRHRLLRLRPAVLALPARLGIDHAHRRRAADAGDVRGAGAALAVPPLRAGAGAPVRHRRAAAGR